MTLAWALILKHFQRKNTAAQRTMVPLMTLPAMTPLSWLPESLDEEDGDAVGGLDEARWLVVQFSWQPLETRQLRNVSFDPSARC
jgi:hypothetical protein